MERPSPYVLGELIVQQNYHVCIDANESETNFQICIHEKDVIYSRGHGKMLITEVLEEIITSMKSIRRPHFDAVCLQGSC